MKCSVAPSATYGSSTHVFVYTPGQGVAGSSQPLNLPEDLVYLRVALEPIEPAAPGVASPPVSASPSWVVRLRPIDARHIWCPGGIATASPSDPRAPGWHWQQVWLTHSQLTTVGFEVRRQGGACPSLPPLRVVGCVVDVGFEEVLVGPEVVDGRVEVRPEPRARW